MIPSLRCLALKVTILQAFKVKPFCHQKWYLNCVVKIPRDNNLWCHFGAKIVLTMVDRKEKRKPWEWYCVAGAPNQQNCQNTTFLPGIQMYQFPSDQAVWVKWVQVFQRCRHDSKYALLCLAHFEESSYERSLSIWNSLAIFVPQ